MAIKIIRGDEPIQINQIVVVVYAAPGLGKTTLGFSADAPLLIDFDHGAYRAAFRGDSVPVDSWTDVTNITHEDLAPYKTVVVDTAGRCLDFLTEDIIRRNPKHGRGGALTLQGYGALKAEFIAWLKMLRLMKKDVVLLAHSSEDKKGDDIIERLDVQGGSKGEIYKCADAMGRISIINGKRILNFSPTDIAFGKNPANLLALTIPDASTNNSFLGEVIASIKDKINALTETQRKRQEAVANWLASFDEAQSVDDYNDLVTNVKSADQSISTIVKGELHKRALAAGLTFSKVDGKYAEAVQ